MSSISKIFENLIGTWSFRRHVQDNLRAIVEVGFNGVAQFIELQNENELLYTEYGVRSAYKRKPIFFSQRYLYKYNSITDHIEKHFLREDAAASPCPIIGEAVHQCGADFYKPTYDFPSQQNFDSFCLTYEVKGPKKDYVISTKYVKSGV